MGLRGKGEACLLSVNKHSLTIQETVSGPQGMAGRDTLTASENKEAEACNHMQPLEFLTHTESKGRK